MPPYNMQGAAAHQGTLTVSLSPGKVVPNLLLARVQHDAAVECRGVSQPVVREVLGPVEHVRGREHGADGRVDLAGCQLLRELASSPSSPTVDACLSPHEESGVSFCSQSQKLAGTSPHCDGQNVVGVCLPIISW